MKVKYIIMAVINGVTKDFNFAKGQKEEAKALYKNLKLRADRVKAFCIDDDDEDFWTDIGKKWDNE